jgi:hypothetical protein
MLASLLPGLRDLRTPLAVGYLCVVALWLLFHQWIPQSMSQAHGPINPLFQLGGILGKAAFLTALSFVAYLLGSILQFKLSLLGTFYIRPGPEYPYYTSDPRDRAIMPLLLNNKASHANYRQLDTFVSTRLREGAFQFPKEDHATDVLRGNLSDDAISFFVLRHDLLAAAYVTAILSNLSAVGTQLQAKNRDLWDSYDRLTSEAQFRFGITPPLIVILAILAVQGTPWWLLLLIVPVTLLFQGYRQYLSAMETLVQAIVLKTVEPPILLRLREIEMRKLEEMRQKSGPPI